MPSPDDPITAAEIADDLGTNIHTIRRLFRDGALRGKKVGINGWTTSTRAYRAWLTTWKPQLDAYPLTTRQIADALGVHILTARRLFTEHGAPGKKLRHPTERMSQWRAQPDAFWAWYDRYRTGQDHPADDAVAAP